MLHSTWTHRLSAFLIVLSALVGAGCRGTGPGPDAGAGFDAGSGDAGTGAQNTGVHLLTQRNNLSRTGANLEEKLLNTTNVRTESFGKLFVRHVVGQVYAQPLYVSGLTVGGRTRNVVYVATEHNRVYAFDADDPAAADPLWQVDLGTPMPTDGLACTDLIPEVGITSTPVIDLPTRTIYVVAKTLTGDVYAQHLHALDLVTGEEKLGGPVEITAKVPGLGLGTDGTDIAFRPRYQLNRPGLVLSGGQLYIAFGSHCDKGPYHGWLLAYDAATLHQTNAFNTTPNGQQGSIWQSGQAPSVDEQGNVYVISANGTTDLANGERSMSILKLSPRLTVLDWFTPYNYEPLNAMDVGLGPTGVVLVPGTRLMLGGSKEGILYVLDRQRLGHYQPDSNSQILQSFKSSQEHLHGSPVPWQGPSGGFVYLWGEDDSLKAFRLEKGYVEPTPVAVGSTDLPPGMPGGILAVSSDGNRVGTGIVWASHPIGNANHATVPGVLRAYDAEDITRELWSSESNPTRDRIGNFAKFTPPTVVNGKVYMATFSDELAVYGLLGASPGAH
ncbi:MAG TPA: hypothetical protein VH877_27505 [Polyangia bacterium]|jgi:hypothetical protein|nr:hypothetical protein [Polyangia bacterium]